MIFRKKPSFFNGDKWLLILPIVLSVFGLLTIIDVSSVSALRDFNNKYHYFANQSLWFVFGIISFFVFSVIDYKVYKKIALPFFIINIIFLILVLIPGVGREIYGGRRWLPVFGFGFQPAELAKFSVILYLATLFEKKINFVPLLTVVGLVLLLLMLEPDLGTSTIIIATAFSLYFIAGAPLKNIGYFLLMSLITGPLLIMISPYRKQRFLNFLGSSFRTDGASYHVKQILIALGSGGIFGRGFGQSRQKFLFLPEVTTDSIFAVIAEEFGLIGSFFLLAAFFYLIFRGLRLSMRIEDCFGRLLVFGIIFCIGIQTLVNLGAMVVLIPLTGVPLPFISYGGSSLLICLSGMGIVYNVSKTVKTS